MTTSGKAWTSPVMYLGPLAVLAMALLNGTDGWVPMAAFLAIYAFVAFVPMTVDLMSADIAGQEPDRSTEERRSTGAIGLLGLSSIVVSVRFDTPVVTLGLCLLLTVASLAVFFSRYLSGDTGGATVSGEVKTLAPVDGIPGDVPAPVPASSHRSLTRTGR
ncbi:hypothetical protein [Arthrobacter sp. zg-Y1110]|uniref:hypothetical protein n=1 Tax=Arthrobacter sp. zg-Y1110 TaxID=2886932 RepID=UPI001D1350DB|nr:hypothetical protein [Arthrobacter sp. zg-Y1110]MCC3292930.1 hypothetical protein [Arthrobacter sp. zg-Y1110]UWX86869.1 hypothetical protein N2K99_18675 [Arthrobacter sp. zg-Y1110]